MKNKLINRWNNTSVATRLYIIVSVMACLIAIELITVSFASRTLSAVRAFVGGESLWSKSQKNAAFSLQRYGLTQNEKDYQRFLKFLEVEEGDHLARIELQKAHPDFKIIKKGFMQGKIHEDDIPSMTNLLRRFYWISYLSEAIAIWTNGDELIAQFKQAGQDYHQALNSKKTNQLKANQILLNIEKLNDDLTKLQEDFSNVLGAGSRWLENAVITLLIFAVLLVEGIGLTLTIITSRYISRGLNEINSAAMSIGSGNFDERVPVRFNDEIGKVAFSLNQMGQILKKSYRDLESRVQERTAELANMAAENMRLYQETKSAVKMRDEFISIASHELKTPLTSLQLQLQLLKQQFNTPEQSSTQKAKELTESGLKQTKRLSTLIDELLDITRISTGKLQIHLSYNDISKIVSECVLDLNPNAIQAGSEIILEAPTPVEGQFDSSRVAQVATNLISNAIKYGNGKPIQVEVRSINDKATISVTDQGIGIPDEKLATIFDRFERVTEDTKVDGLGLGLYISNEITKILGGSIRVKSKLGEGSTFTVELPIQR